MVAPYLRLVDQLVAWAASVGLKARTSVSLRAGGVSGAATVRVPGTGPWLNVTVATLVGIEKGRRPWPSRASGWGG